MGNQPNVETNHEQEPGNRIYNESFGKVLVHIYRNVSQSEGVYYRIKFFRQETDGTKRWLAVSYFREDLVNVAKAATASYIWLKDNTDFARTTVLSVVAKFGRVDESAKQPPVHEVQVGNVLASVWENTSKAGNVYHKVSFRRGEVLDSEEVRFWNNVRPEDLSHVAQAATNCRIWFGSVQRNVVKEDGEKKRPAKRKLQRAAK